MSVNARFPKKDRIFVHTGPVFQWKVTFCSVSVGKARRKRIRKIRQKTKKPAEQPVFIFFCDPPGIRTQDPILKRDVLYLLS